MMEIAVLGCLGVVLGLQGWQIWDFKRKSASWQEAIDELEGNSGEILDGLDSLAPILQAIIERIDGGLEIMERAPESPLAPIIQQGIGTLIQRWVDNTTKPVGESWPDAETRPELAAGSPV